MEEIVEEWGSVLNSSALFAPNVSDYFHNASSYVSNGPLSVSDASVYNLTNSTMLECPAKPKISPIFEVFIKVIYAIGIIGNAAAIIALRRGERRIRNRKHLLLLTSLAANDLVALVGMMCLLVVSEQLPGASSSRAYCAARVVLRVFGVGSVCIAVTMALERYLALTRPFLYQKQVTYYMIRTALLVSWCWAAVLTCAPIIGVGLYYNERCQSCTRYRNAVAGLAFGYAAFYIAFGILLCVVLVYCNLAVIRALYAIASPAGGAALVRRVSRSSCRRRSARSASALHHNAATAEEVAFSRLMAALSVFFMICWMPQMLTSALHLALGAGRGWLNALSRLADMLMLLNYVLDPILYVLMRHKISLSALCHSVAHCFKRNHKTSTESMKTSCCPQETTVISDNSSGGELRPLRAPPCAPPGAAPGAPPGAALVRLDD